MIIAKRITAVRIAAQRITAKIIGSGISAVCRWFSNFNGITGMFTAIVSASFGVNYVNTKKDK